MVGGFAVVGPVGRHRPEGTGDLIEQGADLGGVALLVARQLGREGLTTAKVLGDLSGLHHQYVRA